MDYLLTTRPSTSAWRQEHALTGAGRVQVTVDLTPWFPPPGEQENADEPE